MIQWRQRVYSFDFLKGLILTLGIVLPVSYGFKYDCFSESFCVALGALFASLPNIDGTHRHRVVGILSAILLSLVLVFLAESALLISNWVFYGFFLLAILMVSMLTLYGHRASMLSFSAQLCLVMIFALQKSNIPTSIELGLLAAGGLFYFMMAMLIHWLFEGKSTAQNLADCIENIADLMKLKYVNIWNDEAGNEKRQISLQVKINEQQELLRELLYERRRLGGDTHLAHRYVLIFIEMLDIFELILAKENEENDLKEELAGQLQFAKGIKELSAKNIVSLYALADALHTDGEMNSELASEELPNFDQMISDYVVAVKLPAARKGALLMRDLIDFEEKIRQKLEACKRVYVGISDGKELNNNPKERGLFLKTEDYTLKNLLEHFTLQSSTFRYALRMCLAMLVGLAVGEGFALQNSYWILLTIAVIMRPNFGLTKTRAKQRIMGTIIGAVFAALVIFLTSNAYVYGTLAIISIFIGNQFLQKNYRIAATFITTAIIFLYALTVDNALDIIGLRILDTMIGAFISFLSIHLFWPTWEGFSMAQRITRSLASLYSYLAATNELYIHKKKAGTAYRLARKKAFVDIANTMAAFQRLTEEPKSKQKNASQLYGIVILLQTFLNTTAALSTYVQNHETTEASDAYLKIVEGILNNLKALRHFMENGEQIKNENTDAHLAGEELKKKFEKLEEVRNIELHLPITSIQRSLLQEGRLVTNQLNYLLVLSENMIQTSSHLFQNKTAS